MREVSLRRCCGVIQQDRNVGIEDDEFSKQVEFEVLVETQVMFPQLEIKAWSLARDSALGVSGR